MLLLAGLALGPARKRIKIPSMHAKWEGGGVLSFCKALGAFFSTRGKIIPEQDLAELEWSED